MLVTKSDNDARHINLAFERLAEQVERATDAEARARCLEHLLERLCDIRYLVTLAQGGFVRAVGEHLACVSRAASPADPRRTLAQLCSLCIERHADFLQRHPDALFQTLWNECWWHDCPDLAAHLPVIPNRSLASVPFFTPGPVVSEALESWRRQVEARDPDASILRSMTPPSTRLRPGAPTELRGHSEVVQAVSLSSDGSRLVSMSTQETLLWELELGGGGQRIDSQFAGEPRAAGISGDGRSVVVATSAGDIHVWDIDAAVPKASTTVAGFDGDSSCVANEPNRSRVAFLSMSDRVVLVDTANAPTVRQYEFGYDHGPPQACRFAPEGDSLYIAFATGGVSSLDVETGELTALFRVMEPSGKGPYPLESMSLSRDGRVMCVSGNGGEILLVEIAERRLVARYTVGPELGLTPENSHIPVHSYVLPDGSGAVFNVITAIWRFDAGSGTAIGPLYSHEAFVEGIFVAESGRCATGGLDRTVFVCDAAEATGDLLPREAPEFVGALLVDAADTLLEVASGGPMFAPVKGGSMSMTLPTTNVRRGYSTRTGMPRPVFPQCKGTLQIGTTMDPLPGERGLLCGPSSVEVRADASPWAVSVDLETCTSVDHTKESVADAASGNSETDVLAYDARELKLIRRGSSAWGLDGGEEESLAEVAWYPTYWQQAIVCEAGRCWAGTSSVGVEIVRYQRLSDRGEPWVEESWERALAGEESTEALFGGKGLPTPAELAPLVPFGLVSLSVRVAELSTAALRAELAPQHRDFLEAIRRLDPNAMDELLFLSANEAQGKASSRPWQSTWWAAFAIVRMLSGNRDEALRAFLESCYQAARVDKSLVRWIRLDYSRLAVEREVRAWDAEDVAPLSFFG